jgi:hypothetical protein
LRFGANSGSESLIALYIAGDSFSRPYVHPARAALPLVLSNFFNLQKKSNLLQKIY